MPRHPDRRDSTRTGRDDLTIRIESTGRALRRTISAVLEAVAGPRPRPTRLSRAIGLDKSLASRLIRAVRSPSELDLMHLVPSPGGLDILADLAAPFAPSASIVELRAAARSFQDLIESVPGGRASIDAALSETSQIALSRREHIAKQAAFKSMSFLLGHTCDVLMTSLFLVPAADGRRVDGIEIHRRVGFRRLRPSTPLALLGIWGEPDDAMTEHAIRFETLEGERGTTNPLGFLLADFSSRPLPALEVVRDGDMATLVLRGDPALQAPARLTSVIRIRNGWPRTPEAEVQALRGYVLHAPCRRVVREVHVAESIYAGADPRISFVLPGPGAARRPPQPDGTRHFTELELTSSIEPLPAPSQEAALPEIDDHAPAIRHVLARAGHDGTRFRGWRCAMTYPVPMIEMLWWLAHSATRSEGTPADERR